MKKLITISIVAAMLLGSGIVLGQNTHEVEIRIPDLLMLRITDGSNNAAATDPAVIFDFQADMDTYMAAVNGDGDDLEPTLVTNFGDVIVFANRAAWSVTVSALDIVHDDNLGLSVTGNGVALSDISISPSGTQGLNVSSVATSWDLTTATSIANGVRTQGWRSLGFSGADYRLAANGDEDPGTYTTTVTYTITAP